MLAGSPGGWNHAQRANSCAFCLHELSKCLLQMPKCCARFQVCSDRHVSKRIHSKRTDWLFDPRIVPNNEKLGFGRQSSSTQRSSFPECHFCGTVLLKFIDNPLLLKFCSFEKLTFQSARRQAESPTRTAAQHETWLFEN